MFQLLIKLTLINAFIIIAIFGLSAIFGYDDFGDQDQFLTVLGLAIVAISALNVVSGLLLFFSAIFERKLLQTALGLVLWGVLAVSAGGLLVRYHY